MKLFLGETVNLRKCLQDTYDGGLTKQHDGPATFTSSNPEFVSVAGDVATLVAAGTATITATVNNAVGDVVAVSGSLVIVCSPLPVGPPPPATVLSTNLVDVLGN